MQQTESEILTKVREILKEEGVQLNGETENKLIELILPAMKNNVDVLSSLSAWNPTSNQGVVSKLKNGFIRRVKATTLHIMKPSISKQQKFNHLTHQALSELQSQIDKLKNNE